MSNKSDYYNEDSKGKISPLTIEQLNIISSQLKKNICKIHKINGRKATAFFCKIPFPDQFKLLPVLITNYHVLGKEDLKINKTIKITLDDDNIEKVLLIDKNRITLGNKKIDISLVEIKPNLDIINNFLDIDDNVNDNNYKKIYQNKSIYLLHYPNGGQASFSSGKIEEIYNENIRHSCSTEYGSSGAPILNSSNLKVIGVHKRRTDNFYNEGTYMKFIIEELNNVYKTDKIIPKDDKQFTHKEVQSIIHQKIQPVIESEVYPVYNPKIQQVKFKENQPMVHREIQPIKTFQIQPIISRKSMPVIHKEIQPVITSEVPYVINCNIQPVIQHEVQPIIPKEIQPIFNMKNQPVFHKEIKPVVHREIQPIVNTKIQPVIHKQIQPVFINQIQQVVTKEDDKVQLQKTQDKFEKKVLPTKYQKETLKKDIIKGKVHKEIIRTGLVNCISKDFSKFEAAQKIQKNWRMSFIRKHFEQIKPKLKFESEEFLKKQYELCDKNGPAASDDDFCLDGWKKFYPLEDPFFNFKKGFVFQFGIKIRKANNPNKVSVYEGDVNIKNERHGFGRLTTTKSVFLGEWRNNQFTGWGRETRRSGKVLEGRYIDGVVMGKGILKNNIGNYYIGDFYNSKKHGKGVLDTHKVHYEGEFKNDKLCGKGRIDFKTEGHYYEGEFSENEINGFGTFKWKNGDSYTGQMLNGKMHGNGTYRYNNGQIYVGVYINGVKACKNKINLPINCNNK